MSLHHDLLAQALHLATREPKKPKQASLRRSVSASYYAVFHLLVDSAVRRLVSGQDRTALRNCLRRGFSHATMTRVARQFAGGGVSPKLEPGLNQLRLQTELINVADTFAALQDHRHRADYDMAHAFTRIEALNLAQDARRAFSNWDVVRNTVQADTFLVGLLSLDILRT